MLLAIAATHCELRFGAAWYFNPARWRTVDGYVPFHVLWVAWRRLQAARAADRLDMVKGAVVARAGEQAQTLIDAEMREAYPGD